MSDSTKTGFTFTPRIDLGNLLTMVAFSFTAVAGWFNMDKRQTLSEHTLVEHEKVIKQIVDNQTGAQRTSDRLSFIIDEMVRQHSWGQSAKKP